MKRPTHWECSSPEYVSWTAMKYRCSNPNDTKYAIYGGRGIKVCETWMKYKNFLADMGGKPSPRHSLDRYPDCNGNYEPGNCRWATPAEQNRNNSRTVRLTYKGQTMCVSDWAEKFGVNTATLRSRLWAGWDIERALKAPVKVPQ